MKEQFNFEEEKIKDIRLPREEMAPLLKNLLEGGFSEEEAWRVLAYAKMSKRETKTDPTRMSIETDIEGWEQALRESGEFSEKELENISKRLRKQPTEIQVTIVPSESISIPVDIEHGKEKK